MQGFKKKFLVVAVLIMSVGMSLCLLGCKQDLEPIDILKKNISVENKQVFIGENDNLSARYVAGTHCERFIADGKVETVSEIAKLNIMFKGSGRPDADVKFKLVGDKGEVEGVLKKDALGAGFSATIDSIEKIGAPASISIDFSAGAEQMPMTSCMQGITSDEALQIAYDALAEIMVDDFGEANSFNREILIKYINNPSDFNSDYFWYVAFVKSNTDFFAVLIDPVSKEIVSQRGF